MPINDNFLAGQILTAQECNNFPRGLVAPAVFITTAQSGITSVVDITGASITFTAVTGRMYKASFSATVSATAASSSFQIRLTDASNVQTNQQEIYFAVASGAELGMDASFTFTATGSTTRKLRALRGLGTASFALSSGATQPLCFWIEDIGPSA